MSVFFFILFLLIIIVIFFVTKKIYNEKYKNRKEIKKTEYFDKTIIYNDYKVDNIKEIKEKDSYIILIFERKKIEIEKEKIKYVSQYSEEKVEVNCELPHKIEKDKVFNYLIENTFFYITKERYNKLVSSKAKS